MKHPGHSNGGVQSGSVLMPRSRGSIAFALACLLGVANCCVSKGTAQSQTPGESKVAAPDSLAITTPRSNVTRAGLFPANAPTERDYPSLHNLLQVTDRVFSGGEPVGADAFASLAKLGIKTIVSVDGSEPNVAEAKKHGLRYVHIPIGYDGVTSNAALSFTRVMRDVAGPVYFHCHHGTHRGPAAAAVACVAAGVATPVAALEILKRAGTSTNYAGLWRDVAAFMPPRPQTVLPDLTEIAKVDSMVAAMAKIDRAFDNLKLCRQADWGVPPGHPDLVPSQEALLLKEALRETGRTQTANLEERFRLWLSESEVLAGRLESSLRTASNANATRAFDELNRSCTRCHKAYRN